MKEKNIPLKVKAVLLLGAATTIGTAATGCANQEKVFEVGDKVTIGNNITGIDDYNQIYKDTCTLEEGSTATIEEISWLNLPAERAECFEDKASGRKECYSVPNRPTVIRLNNGKCNTWVLLDELEESTDSLKNQK